MKLKLIRAITLSALTISEVGCSSFMGDGVLTPMGEGRILINADSEGMMALSDLINGSITNGKASPDTVTPYYQVRTTHLNTRRGQAIKSYTSFAKKEDENEQPK